MEGEVDAGMPVKITLENIISNSRLAIDRDDDLI